MHEVRAPLAALVFKGREVTLETRLALEAAMDPTFNIILVVLLFVCAIYGVVTKDWRANFGSLAVGLFLLVLVVIGRR